MDLTPKQQTSEAIRQAENILITTGQRPSVDQVTAVLALATILRKFGKKVSAIVSDPLPAQVSFLDTTGLDKSLSGLRDFILRVDVTKAEAAGVMYGIDNGKLNINITPARGGFAPSDVTFDYGDFHYDLAIVLGVPSVGRIDRVYAQNQSLFAEIPLVNIDFHRSNDNYGAVNLIEGNASSLNEILVATSESLQTGLIDETIATIMLTGLMASTDRFTATHTTSKSLTVAAQMMAAGAHQQEVVKGLFGSRSDRDNRGQNDRGDRPSTRSGLDQSRDNRSDRDSAPRQSTDAQPAKAQSRDAAPVAEQPTPELVPHEAPVPTVEPIIEPGHMELELDTEPHEEHTVADDAPMADFAAAAEILAQHPAAQGDDAEPAQQ